MEDNLAIFNSILDDAERRANNDAALLEAFNLLTKLINNMIMNPTEEKYKNIKTTNQVLKAKLFNIPGINAFLEHIGFVLVQILFFQKVSLNRFPIQNGEFYTYRSADMSPIVIALLAIQNKTRHVQEKKLSPEELARRREVEAYEKELHEKFQKEREEEEKIKKLMELDKRERANKLLPTQDIKAAEKKGFGAKTSTWKDIGVDLCAQKKG
eukprot:TRINITY_DN1082_c0_g1_i20.p2 TRINITY_DN1082_c0_g1~~TRINITY_DN1082_c0_g1_i20.p2  ORF type:complete len:212 (-),score=52.43 TRINITY_DN1082_c0_g1_i20:367-1002(-)